MRVIRLPLLALLAGWALLLSTQALAGEAEVEVQPTASEEAEAQVPGSDADVADSAAPGAIGFEVAGAETLVAEKPKEGLAAWSVLTTTELSVARAGTDDGDIVSQQSTITSTMSENAIGDNSQTGSISVADGAFGRSTGIQSSMVNSGNQVSMQSSININVKMP